MANEFKTARAAADKFKTWLASSALPLWATAGFDGKHGRFCERLDLAGRPIETVPQRAMVQGRQIYVFAHAAHLGWFPEGARLADIAMRSLLRDFSKDSGAAGGFAFSIGTDGRIVSGTRDAYAHAFVLFALAWLYRVTSDPKLLKIADETIVFIDANLQDPVHGGLFDEVPTVKRDKRQNPHMHLLEAYLALERSFPGRGYLERAAKLIDLFKSTFLSAEHGVLLEYFAEDWGPHPDAVKRLIFEPGHHFEWVWLLDEFEALSREDVSGFSERLFTVARQHGIGEKGLIFDELTADLAVLKPSHRIWPHTEGAKAAVARNARKDPSAPQMASAMVDALTEVFLDKPFDGGWIDHIGPEHNPLVDYVPASSLYHLFFAGTELAREFLAPQEAP
jgi:mannose/cellobiose epimerase-like protein (N-acyl-D-glucosamine 2-epimerase family)